MKRLAWLGVVVAVVLFGLAAGCGSLDKTTLTERMLALPGNAARPAPSPAGAS